MADTTTNNQPLIGGDSENFMRLMNRALTRIEQVDSATTKANESLNNYAKSFDELNSKLERYVKLSGNAKSGKFDRITINERVQNVGGSRRNSGWGSSSSNNSGNNNQYAREAKRITDNITDTIFKSINSLGGKQARVVTSTFKKITNTVADVKTLGKGAKAAQNMAKTQKAATAATGVSSKAIAGMGTAAVGATTVVAGVAVVLGAMAEAGKYAYERNMGINRSLMMMGDTASEMTSSSSKTANQMIGIKNTWTRIGDDLSSVFESVFTVIVDFIETISKAVESVTSPLDKDSKRRFNSSDSKVRWYTSSLEKVSGEPENTSLPVIGNIASTAKQSGFDNTSAANLAIGTYDMAIKKARQYGVEASKVAQKLADAWTTGSDAAKEYGVVVDDQTLIGYMASKGVDIVNTQISDAMKQYYRYELMQTELKADSNDAMQNQIKQWKQLGMQIDATKQKLFSFDEVIQLSALNTEIPTVGTPGVSYPNGDESGSTGPVAVGTVQTTIPTIPNMDTSTQQSNVEDLNNKILDLNNTLVDTENKLNLINGSVDTNTNLLNNNSNALVNNNNAITSNSDAITSNSDAITSNSDAMVVNSSDIANNSQMVAIAVQNNRGMYSSLTAVSSGFNTTAMYANEASNAIEQVGSYSIDTRTKVNSLKQALESLIGSLTQVISLQSRLNSTNYSTSIVPYSSSSSSNSTGVVPYSSNRLSSSSNTSSSSSKSSGAKTGGAILSPFDIVTEGADLIQSLKDPDKGKYNWKNIGSALGDMVVNSIKQPIITTINSVKSGYSQAKDNTSGFLWGVPGGVLGGLTGGVSGLASWATVETLGDLAALSEISQDALISLYNKSTGKNVTATTHLSDLNDWFNDLLGSMQKGDVLGLDYLSKWTSGVRGFASGGIGTKEATIRAFEGDKKEAVIPLETQAGVDYLANAMKQAGATGDGTGSSGSVTVNLTLSGVNIADNDAQWQKVGEKIAEVIEVQKQRRGDLNYGSSF